MKAHLLPFIFCFICFSNTIAAKPGEKLGEVDFDLSCQPRIHTGFNRAMALLHSFEYQAARKIFKQLSRQDKSCAMAHWGIAMTYLQFLWAPPSSSDFKEASESTALAESLADSASEKERRFIHALRQYFDGSLLKPQASTIAPATCHGVAVASSVHREKIAAYRQAMAGMYRDYAEDIEIALLYALSLIASSDPQDQRFSKQLQAGKIMQMFVKSHPNHPGLAHYIIHAYDTPQLAENAIDAARRYALIAPDSAHARHMPSHIFQRLGMWHDSIQSNLAATESARNFAKRTGIHGHWDEELHGIDFLANAYLQTGEYQKARILRDYIYSMESFHPENFKVAYVLSATPARYALERRDWTAAAELPLTHNNFPWQNFPWERAITHFARAYGWARLGELNNAGRESAVLAKVKNTLLKQQNFALATRVNIQELKIQAWTAFVAGKPKLALKKMTKAAEMEWRTVIPTGAIIPAYEMLGEMYLNIDENQKALEAYEKSLSREKNRRASVIGALVAASILKDTSKMVDYQERLDTISTSYTQKQQTSVGQSG